MPTLREPVLNSSSRREFIKGSLAALAGGVGGIGFAEHKDRSRAMEHANNSELESIFFDAHVSKVEYPEYAIERTENIQQAIDSNRCCSKFTE